MQKISWIQWFIRVIKKDMNQYQEDIEVKQEVYKTVKRKSKYNKSKKGKEL